MNVRSQPSANEPTETHADSTAPQDANKTMVISDLDFTIQHETPAPVEPEFKMIGPYRIVKVIGFGGVGTVYEAVDNLLNRPVALKVLNKKWLNDDIVKERFVREAKLCSMIKSSHVPLIHQVGEDKGVPYLAMELLSGFTLEELMRTNHQLSIAQIIRLGREMAKGLAAAHAMKLIHRDIKPSNIWLETMPDPSGGERKMFRVKILDFGMARLQEQAQGLTRHGVIVGTPLYMSPEQATGGKAIDSRSDLFSLGVVLYHLSTGKLPFSGKTVLEILTNLTSTETAPPRDLNPQIPTKLSNLISRMMKKKPDDRPPDAMNVARLLEIIEDEERATAKRAKPKPTQENTPQQLIDDATIPSMSPPMSFKTGASSLRNWLIASLAVNVILLMTIIFLLGMLWQR